MTLRRWRSVSSRLQQSFRFRHKATAVVACRQWVLLLRLCARARVSVYVFTHPGTGVCVLCCVVLCCVVLCVCVCVR